jgi:hypothetical protein
MNVADSRIDYITQELHNHWVNLVCIPVILVVDEEWDSNAIEELGPVAACGWAWPLYTDDDERIVTICPEIIAQTTEHLHQEHLDDYLGIIEFVVDRHITLMVGDPDMDPWDRHKKILDNLQEDHPAALGLLQEIQVVANK